MCHGPQVWCFKQNIACFTTWCYVDTGNYWQLHASKVNCYVHLSDPHSNYTTAYSTPIFAVASDRPRSLSLKRRLSRYDTNRTFPRIHKLTHTLSKHTILFIPHTFISHKRPAMCKPYIYRSPLSAITLRSENIYVVLSWTCMQKTSSLMWL